MALIQMEDLIDLSKPILIMSLFVNIDKKVRDNPTALNISPPNPA
jgi:hypothetical protein